jgi:hypothetical protein
VSGINVKGTCRLLHFIHATGWQTSNGTPVGHYLVHYANGNSETIALNYGVNIAEWWAPQRELSSLSPGTVVAWTGTNPIRQRGHENVYLFKFTWTNPYPDWAIATIDFSSALAKPAPFLIAITAEK